MTYTGHISAFPGAWVNKFADLQVIPGRSILEPMDGDIAWLVHLVEQTFELRPARLASIPRDFIWRQTIDALGFNPDHIDWNES